MAAHTTKRKPTRAERLAAAAAARRRRQLRTRIAIAAGVATAVAVAVIVIVSDRRDHKERVQKLESGNCDFDTRSDRDQGQGSNHVPAPTYSVEPPAGGDHLAEAAGPGRYSVREAPPDGQIVHSMEHGYVVLWHRPDADEATMKVLNDIAARHERDILVVPRASLPGSVVATAWHNRLSCGATDPAALELFVRTYTNKGPERVPH